MYTVYTELYRDDADSHQHVLGFDSLDGVFSWVRELPNLVYELPRQSGWRSGISQCHG